MPNQKPLNLEIEQSRQLLYALEQKYGLTHASVLRQSMILDELINEYNRKFHTRTSHSFTGNNQLVHEEFLPDHSYLHSSMVAVMLS